MKEKNKISFKKILYIVLIIMTLSVLGYNSYLGIDWFMDKKENDEETAEINQELSIEEVADGQNVNPPIDKNNDYWYYITMPLINVDISKLKKINRDTIGFLSVSGTNINYPVVQTTNNSYYISHSFKKQSNKAGWIFMDYRNSAVDLSQNTIIYGHSRLDTTMFGTLKNILKTSWLKNKNNYIVKLSTETENTMWQVFSVYTISTENYYLTTNFNNNIQYQAWLNKMINRSEYNFKTTVNTNDKVLTLSTCHGSSKRVVMQAKLIKRVAKSVENF